MTQRFQRITGFWFCLSLQILAAPFVFAGQAGSEPDAHRTPDQYLYVWAGDQARKAPDFIAVIDFDPSSSRYGHVVKTVPLPPPGNTGNEPHHCGISADQKILGCGGLLSLWRNQNGIFFFDISDAANPELLFSTRAVHSAVTDDFYPLEEGGFLITQMGSETGGAPGRLAEYSDSLGFVGNHFGSFTLRDEWPSSPPLDGFNPHGISVRPDLNLMLTSDYVLPNSTLLGAQNAPVFRSSIRVWDFHRRLIISTISVPGGGGMMDVKLIPNNPQGLAYTAGMTDGYIYLVEPYLETAKPVFNTNDLVPPGVELKQGTMPQLTTINSEGTRLYVSLFQSGQIAVFDITDPYQPKVVQTVNLGLGSGPHSLLLTEDGKRLVVGDYFLNEDNFGQIHMEGDHKVRAFWITPEGLVADPRFEIDFNHAFPTGPARPHGMAVKVSRVP